MAARIIVYGNSGSGKTTMARALSAELGIPHLDLDTIAWGEVAVRKPIDESIAELRFEAFTGTKRRFGDLAAT